MLSLVEARFIQRAIAETDIVVAANSTSTLELAKVRNPDVTILDTELAEIDALSLHRLLSEIVAPDTILVTSNQPSAAFQSLMEEEKIFDLLIRPFPVEALTSSVEQILQRQGIEVVPYKSSIPPSAVPTKQFDRHLALNQLSGILGAVRALEAEIEAEGNAPPNIVALIDEYVPRIVEQIQDVAQNIKLSRNKETMQ